MRGGINTANARRSSKNKRSGKYARQFHRTAANKARRIRKNAA